MRDSRRRRHSGHCILHVISGFLLLNQLAGRIARLSSLSSVAARLLSRLLCMQMKLLCAQEIGGPSPLSGVASWSTK